MIRTSFLLAVIFLCSPAYAADCATDVKATDNYSDLASKLKCLNDRITRIESANTASTSERGNAKQEAVFLQSGSCLSYSSENQFKTTILVSLDGDARKKNAGQLCWNDGATFAKVLRIEPDFVDLRNAGGDLISTRNQRYCSYNTECMLTTISGGKVVIIAEKMVGKDNIEVVRLSIQNKPGS